MNKTCRPKFLKWYLYDQHFEQINIQHEAEMQTLPKRIQWDTCLNNV